MEMSAQLTPSKRPNETEANGGGKLQKNGSFSSPGSSVKGGSLRVLFPSKNIGSVIGVGGSIIKQIRLETGVKIRVEEPIPGCLERVITLSSLDKDDGKVYKQGSKEFDEGTGETEPGKNEQNEENQEGDSGDAVAEGGEKQDIAAVQKALLVVFEKMVEGESEKDGGEVEEGPSCAARVLMCTAQIGCLLGVAGSVIKPMSADSGAQIRILPRDKLPPFASATDEVVQISGEPDAVRKALISVSKILLENPDGRDQRPLSGHPSGPSPHSGGRSARQEAFAQPNPAFHGQGPPSGFSDRRYLPQDLLSYRLWCPYDKIGGVIGRGGGVVRAIQFETGCEINVLDAPAGSEDRIIVISGPAHPDERISAPQNGLLRVQTKIVRGSSENQEKIVIAKLLVSSYQIGCLLGKGGSVMTEMRKSTGASIRILAKDQNPQGALDNDEVVQVNGEFEPVQEALLQITHRLREYFFREAFPSINYPSNPAFHDQGPPFSHFMGRGDHSPTGRYPVGGLHHSGGFHDERPPFLPNFNRPSFPPHISERFPSSAQWGAQGPIEGGGPDFMRGPPRGIAGFLGGNHGAIITSTTVEVVVPRNVVPAIYGEGGGCLRQIREISDAKITIADTKPGVPETVIIISGTPEQTNAAQSLIQAFVIIEGSV